MSEKVEVQSSGGFDTLKWLLVIVLFSGLVATKPLNKTITSNHFKVSKPPLDCTSTFSLIALS